MDAIALLKQDHREVEEQFKRFEKLGDNAYKQLQHIGERVIALLSKHAAIEEELLYPAARELSDDLEEKVLESLEEHHVAKATLAELDKLSAEDERYCAKFTVLMESIRHHVKEEEGELFPQLRELMSRAQLEALGAAMKQAKSTAPTRPHPLAPDTPPGNIISGKLAAVLDMSKDLARATLRRTRRAVSSATEARARRPKRQQRGTRRP